MNKPQAFRGESTISLGVLSVRAEASYSTTGGSIFASPESYHKTPRNNSLRVPAMSCCQHPLTHRKWAFNNTARPVYLLKNAATAVAFQITMALTRFPFVA